jgi:hypothetical protein
MLPAADLGVQRLAADEPSDPLRRVVRPLVVKFLADPRR